MNDDVERGAAGRPGHLPLIHEDLRDGRINHTALPDVGDDANNFPWLERPSAARRIKRRTPAHEQALAHGAGSAVPFATERFVDQERPRPARAIGLLQAPAFDDANAHDFEIAWLTMRTSSRGGDAGSGFGNDGVALSRARRPTGTIGRDSA